MILSFVMRIVQRPFILPLAYSMLTVTMPVRDILQSLVDNVSVIKMDDGFVISKTKLLHCECSNVCIFTFTNIYYDECFDGPLYVTGK